MSTGLSLIFGTAARSSYQEQKGLSSFEDIDNKKLICRIYPDKLGGTQTPSLLISEEFLIQLHPGVQ
jgi:hypothetical protein